LIVVVARTRYIFRNLLELPRIDPAQVRVQPQCRVLYDDRLRKHQQSPQTIQRDAQRISCRVSFGIRPQSVRQLCGSGRCIAPRDQRLQQFQGFARRLAPAMDRNTVDGKLEVAERSDHQRALTER
jgi:hypothetical protein